MDNISKLKEYIVSQVSMKNLSAFDAEQFIEALSSEKQGTDRHVNDVAIIGYDCKLPGADKPEIFWDNILSNRDCIGGFPKARMDDVTYINENTYEQYKLLNCRVGGYLESIDKFDYEFFGLSPIEARDMDPNHRLFLETSVRALEHAGLTKDYLDNSKTGVFVGYSISEDNFADLLEKDNPNLALGNQPAMLPYRLAFMYNLRGPTMAIDTSCSSSLVCVHMAKRAIENGDCDQAIVSGVNIRVFPAIREIANLGIEAFDGKCKPFDVTANGTNIGDGIVTLVLKRKDWCIRDQDKIQGLLLGSAINSDGASNGLSAPNPDAQADVLTRAWSEAKLNPEQIDFFEAHGTGTKLGDPIEIHGLTIAARKHTNKKQFIPLGSVKANIGHLEASAGISGLLKTLLCIEKRRFPGLLHFNKPNPYIDFKDSPMYVPSDTMDWRDNEKALVAGVSSFGISGTNCHMVVGEYRSSESKKDPSTGPYLIFISAKSINSLIGNISSYQSIRETVVDFSSVSFSSITRRDHHRFRVAMVVKSQSELVESIDNILSFYEKHGGLDMFLNQSIFYVDTESHGELDIAKADIDGGKRMLLEDYLAGNPMDWTGIIDNEVYTPLPVYNFDSVRCWPKLAIDKGQDDINRINNLFYDVAWEKQVGSPPQQVCKNKHQILFVRESLYADVIVDVLKENDASIIVVKNASQYKKIDDDNFEIRIDKPEDYEILISDLNNRDIKIDTIIHGFDWCQESPAMRNGDALIAGQNFGALSLFFLVNALDKYLKNIQCKLVSLSTSAHRVTPDDSMLDPSRTTALGVNKVLSQEYPRIESIFMDCDIPKDPRVQCQMIFDETVARPHLDDHILAIREGQRYRQVLKRINKSDLKSASEPLIKDGKTYLIAGGSGYLGMETALHLAKKSSVKIAIVSRSNYSFFNKEKLDEQENPKLKRMLNIVKSVRLLGSKIFFIQGDVTEINSCQAVIDQCRETFHSIDGVFLAIKNISHKRLNDVSLNEFKSNILAKLQSVYLLDKLTENDEIDLFVTFSSISSLTGGPTGADCSASNLFLDSYSDYRNEVLGRKTITLNYTLIDADDGSLDSDRLTMIPPLTKEECFQCMDVFLDTDLNFAVMADFASNVTHKVLSYLKINFSEEILLDFKKFSKSSSTAVKKSAIEISNSPRQSSYSSEDIETALRQAFVEVLGREEVKPHDNFFDIGGDSISAVKMIDRLKSMLQMDVDVSILYDHPSIVDLTNYFVAEQKEEKNVGNSTPVKLNTEDLLDQLDEGKFSVEELAEQL